MRVQLFLALFFVALNTNAAPIKGVEGTKDICQKAVDFFAQGNTKKSMEVLKPYWPLPSEEIDNLVYQTDSQLKMVSSRFGAMIGSDFVTTKLVGTSFVQHTFVVKFEKHAVRYFCTFYKPKDEWLVNSVTWDDKITLLFQ